MNGAGHRCVRVIGPLPPPMNGQSVYTLAISETWHVRYGDRVSISALGVTLASKIRRTFQVALDVLCDTRGDVAIYATPPGQSGVWLFLIVMLAARAKHRTIFLHHHSFRAVGGRTPLLSTMALVAVCGRRQRHILLGHRMADGYARLYFNHDKGKLQVLSNAWLYPPLSTELGPHGIVLGHLSVITREKGVHHVIAVHKELRRRGLDAELRLAGPIADPSLNVEVVDYCKREGSAQYLGSVSGDAKEDFLRSISALLLPSRLRDEAEPLVMLEALQRGRTFFGSDVGCISEIISSDFILAMDVQRDADLIAGYHFTRSPAERQKEALALSTQAYERARHQFDALSSEMFGDGFIDHAEVAA